MWILCEGTIFGVRPQAIYNGPMRVTVHISVNLCICIEHTDTHTHICEGISHCVMIPLQYPIFPQPIPPHLTHTYTHKRNLTFSSHSCLAVYASANQYVQFWRNTASPWKPGLLSYEEESCKPCSLVSVPDLLRLPRQSLTLDNFSCQVNKAHLL